MTRTNRTLLVFALSLLVAGGASVFMYRTVQAIPVREVEVKNYQVAVAAKALPVGAMVAPGALPRRRWAASDRAVSSNPAGSTA